MLDKAADVSEAVTKQLKTLSELAVEDVFPPVPAAVAPVAMLAEVHFATLVAEFMETLEYGMEGTQAVCTNSVRALPTEMEELQRMVEVYLRRHYITLSECSANVRELFPTAMNSGLKDGMTALATQGGVLHRKHPFAAPTSGTGLPMTTLSFTRLRERVEEGTGTSLVERMAFWRQASGKTAGPSGAKRKGATGVGGQRKAYAQGWVGAGEGATTSKARMLEQQTPAGVCAYAWRGTMCPRVKRLFTPNQAVCLPTTKLSVQPQSSRRDRAARRRAAAAAASTACAAAAPTAATAAAASGSRSSAGGGQQAEEVEGLGLRASPALAGTTRPVAGAERDGAMAATDSTGSAVRQGRPKAG